MTDQFVAGCCGGGINVFTRHFSIYHLAVVSVGVEDKGE